MKGYIRRATVFCFIIFLLSGCSKLNPFSPPDVGNDNDQQVDAYMEDIDKKIDTSEKKADEDAKEFEDKFDKKTEDIYYNAMDKLLEPDTDDSDETFFSSTLRRFYKTYIVIRYSAVWITIGSIVLGAVGCFFSRHNKSGLKFFLIAFCIVIPLLVVFIVFGVGSLNQLYLG